MAEITIGDGATDRGSYLDQTNYTYINLGGAANGTGTITSVEIWTNSTIANCKVGTFFGSGTTWENRDYETIGEVTSGSKQTFSGLSIDVEEGDIIGIYFTAGRIEADTSGGSGVVIKYGDQFGQGEQSSYTLYSDNIISVYGIGETATTGTNTQINIGDTWKEIAAIQVNVGDVWKEAASAKVNVGDSWKEVY